MGTRRNSLIEEITGCDNLNETYDQIYKVNNVYRLDDKIVYKSHVEYIMRLSKQEKNKSLAISDSGWDTHVFGCGWTTLFVQDIHKSTSRFNWIWWFFLKKSLEIWPHAALIKLNIGKNTILRVEHGVSNPTANHTLLYTFECRESWIVIDNHHKRNYKLLDGIKGTKFIQFYDHTTIELTYRTELMTFETEKLNLEDL